MQVVEPRIVAVCPGCEDSVLDDGNGRTVDPEGQTWHPECRKVYHRKRAGMAKARAAKGGHE